MSADNTRLWIVRAGVVLGMFSLSFIALNARGLGPAGRATGGATGCNAGEDVAAARDLVANPAVVDLDRTFDPSRFEAKGPYQAVDGQLILSLDPSVDALDPGPELSAALRELGVLELTAFIDRVPDITPEEAAPFANFVVAKTAASTREAIKRLSEVETVAWVEPVTEIEALSTNSVGRPLQWNLDVVGEPWLTDHTRMGEGAIIAILDSGLGGPRSNRDLDPGFQHPGWDFVDGDAEPFDGFGHGTLVTNVISQQADAGFAGLAPNATVLPTRVLDNHGRGNTLDLAAAVIYASLEDADVILMSLGGYNPSLLVSEALDFADANGAVLVAAAGNDGLQQLAFPASHPAVISVGAVNPDLETTNYTNAAAQVDLFAPGGDLTADLDGDEVADGIVAMQNGRWMAAEGTSLAAAHVAAIAAVAVADAGIASHQLRRGLRVEREDKVIEAQQVVEGARQLRDGAPVVPPAAAVIANRLHFADFGVELAWETDLPSDTHCTWDGGEVSRPRHTAIHRVVLDLSLEQETHVVCTTTDTAGKAVEREFVVQPPAVAAAAADPKCAPLGGSLLTPVRIDGALTGSAGAVCEVTP